MTRLRSVNQRVAWVLPNHDVFWVVSVTYGMWGLSLVFGDENYVASGNRFLDSSSPITNSAFDVSKDSWWILYRLRSLLVCENISSSFLFGEKLDCHMMLSSARIKAWIFFFFLWLLKYFWDPISQNSNVRVQAEERTPFYKVARHLLCMINLLLHLNNINPLQVLWWWQFDPWLDYFCFCIFPRNK